MSTRYRRMFLFAFLLLLLVAAPSFARAQSTSAEPVKPANAQPIAKKPQDPSRQVPPFFGQVGLTIEQRESIYAIRAKHEAKLAELEAEIKRIKASMLTECESILTATQKDLLTKRRAIDTERREAEAAKAKAAKPRSSVTSGPADPKKDGSS